MTDDALQIHWYPGHMAKTRRQMEADLKLVDAVCELLDARIPYASRNPDIDAICGSKPRLTALNRADLADPKATARWREYFRARGVPVIETECKSRKGVAAFVPAVEALLAEKRQKYRDKGQIGRALRVMVVGIPNVGKSTFINQVSGRSSAKAENRPGVTRGKQWVAAGRELLLLDTPGILWPRFDDPRVARLLAYTGAVRDEVLDAEGLAGSLAETLYARYPASVRARYGVELPEGAAGHELLAEIGRRRGFLVSGGGIDTERAARMLLEEYRNCRIGRFTLEDPDVCGGIG